MKRGLKMLPVLALLGSMPLQAADPLEQRVERLERLLDTQTLVEMMTRLDALQQEFAELRGEMEQQRYELEGLKQRQRELYLDVDRRLSRLEREDSGASMAAPPTVAQDNGAVSAAPVATDPQQLEAEREAYQQAFNLLRDLRYEQAITAFREFLNRYPSGRYAHIAQYWLGEADYARRDFKQAIADYQALLSNYPQSPKLAEAMLKIGYCLNEMGQIEQARAELERLIARYPASTEASQAKTMLKRLREKASQ